MTLADQAHFNNYDPTSFGWGGTMDVKYHPSLLVPFEHSGVYFGTIHRDVHGLFTAFLDKLVPHIKGGLRAGRCGAYNPNSVLSDGVTRSFHARGIAVDLNWTWNPMGQPGAIDRPDAGDLYEIAPEIAHPIAREFGLEYGGDWNDFKDYMHFECHLTPSVARSVTGGFTMDAEAKAAFANLNARLDEVERQLRVDGVRVAYINGADNNDADKAHNDAHNPETLFKGIPGYKTVEAREAGA